MATASKKTAQKLSARRSITAPEAAPRAAGVIGLGIMGSAMSANLVKAGFQVFGYDPGAQARSRLKKAGGVPCGNATEVARQSRFIVLSLPSEAALDQVCVDLIAANSKGLVVAET